MLSRAAAARALREKIAAAGQPPRGHRGGRNQAIAAAGHALPVPVEVIPFGWRSQARYLESLGATYTIREQRDGSQFVTDSGNMILDCQFGPIADVRGPAAAFGARVRASSSTACSSG